MRLPSRRAGSSAAVIMTACIARPKKNSASVLPVEPSSIPPMTKDATTDTTT